MKKPPKLPDPPDPEDIGRATWTFLHTMAATYPRDPNEKIVQDTYALLRSLGLLYPCKLCRDEWATQMQNHPPTLRSRAELEKWMCDRHNDVNVRLNKAPFDCSRVHQRWKKKT